MNAPAVMPPPALVTWFYAPELAAGGTLARAICVFLTAFWIVRWIAALFLVRPYLVNRWWRLGYSAPTSSFARCPSSTDGRR
ncbi:MAG: hypothetical protein NTV51_28825 [Verrucomicrobia bacterium]|nr:hypothetical protein [Verrucomicrobiota bacterium]